MKVKCTQAFTSYLKEKKSEEKRENSNELPHRHNPTVEPEWTDPHYIDSHIKGTREDSFLGHVRVIKLTKPNDAFLIGGQSSYLMRPIKTMIDLRRTFECI